MSEWKEYKLGDICDITSSRRIFLNEYVKEGVPFYRSKEIIEKAKGNNISTELFITNERYDEIKRKNFVPVENDILITSVGTLGVSYMLSKKDFFYFKDGNLTWLRNYSNLVYPKYLLYWLRSNIAKEKFNEISIGSTQPAITIQGLKGLQLKLPKHSTQTTIAEILSSLDDKIELNNKINHELETLAQTLFKQWFIDFEFPNENGEPYKSSGGEMVESHLGEIPKGWETKTLNDITNISIGRTPPRQEHQWFSTDINDVKWISIRDMGNCGAYIHNTSEFLTEDAIIKFNIPIIEKNTLIMSFKLTVGRVSITTERMLSNEAIAHLNINNSEIYPEFLYLFLKQFNFDSLGSTSSIATAVNSKSIKSLPLIFPKIDILSKFEDIITPLFSRINNLTFENKDITNLRNTLLPKLISGELEINETNN